MNILITGATGFIGRHLANALSKGEYSVRCLARKSSNIDCLKNINVDIFYGDLLEKDSISPALEKIDLIYHLAGEVYSRRKDDYYKGNILGTQNLLEVCKEKGTKRIIFLSSIGVYKPATKKTLLTEESECEPLTFYGKTKLDAERLIKKYNIPWVVVRAPVIYGPYQPYVISKIFLDALYKKRIYIIGDGENLRSMCFINNLIEGLMLIADKPGVEGKTYILSDNSPCTLNEIATTMSMVINRKIKIVHLPNTVGDISWKIYNLMGKLFGLYFVELYAIKTMQINLGCEVAKAKKEIGYSPSISFEAGIKSTIEWIRNNN